MDDDFNTADALAAIFELVKLAQYSNVRRAHSARAFAKLLRDDDSAADAMFMGLIAEPKEELLDADIEELIEERQAGAQGKELCTVPMRSATSFWKRASHFSTREKE